MIHIGRNALMQYKTLFFNDNRQKSEAVRSPCTPFPIKSKATRRALRSRSSSRCSPRASRRCCRSTSSARPSSPCSAVVGYTVTGTTAAYGVDNQPISDNDIYLFTLHEGRLKFKIVSKRHRETGTGEMWVKSPASGSL